MIKKILSFIRKKEEEPSLNTSGANKEKTDLSPYIKDIESLLKIECPEIQSVACIYEAYSPLHGHNMMFATNEFRRNELPPDAGYCGGYYPDDREIILLARKLPLLDFEEGTVHFRNVTRAEKLFFLAHEMRHVWQKKYEPQKYYNENAIAMEGIHDPAEIDADAFALSYVFSKRTDFTYEDFPTTSSNIGFYLDADNGKRWERLKQLAEEFDLACHSKLDQFAKNLNKEEIKLLMLSLKKSGVI